MFSSIRNSNNSLLQGAIFRINLVLRSKRYQYCLRQIPNGPYKQLSELRRYKQSDTLFILGSGSSIAEFGDREIDHIGKHDSIGFNFWLLHPFVPTYYTVEFIASSERSGELWNALKIRAEEYRSTPVIFKYSKGFRESAHLIPKALKEIFLTSQLNIPGSDLKSLSKWLLFLRRKKLFHNGNDENCIVYRQASVSWLITLGLRLGYKKIVLCGIDLKKPEYFYDIDKSFPLSKGLPIPGDSFEGQTHPTESLAESVSQTPISSVLQTVNETVLKPEGVELFIASRSSALYPAFDLYDWK